MSLPFLNGYVRPADYTTPRLTLRRTDRVLVGLDSISGNTYHWWQSLKDVSDMAFGSSGNKTKPTWIVSSIDGTATANVLGDETARIITHAPTVFFMMVGIGDVLNGAVAGFASRYTSIMNTVMAALPTLRVCHLGPWQWGGLKPSGANANDAGMDTVNTLIAAEAAARGQVFVNVRAAYFANPFTGISPNTLFADPPSYIHPTALGQGLLTSVVVRRVDLDLT